MAGRAFPNFVIIMGAVAVIMILFGTRFSGAVEPGHVKDPASKLYFINSDSPMPLPLIHPGQKQ